MRVYVETVPETKEDGAHYCAPSEMSPENKATTNESPVEQGHKDSPKCQLLSEGFLMNIPRPIPPLGGLGSASMYR